MEHRDQKQGSSRDDRDTHRSSSRKDYSYRFAFRGDERFLGQVLLTPQVFDRVEERLCFCSEREYLNLNHQQKSDRINRLLFDLIEEKKGSTFLLPAVLDFIDKVNQSGYLYNYSFSAFEIWLNQFSGISNQQHQIIRGKIVGKCIPRNEYQRLFPIGMGKIYPGSHVVAGHASADLDTTVASFWGWVDAFGARVSEGLHLWNLPGGPPLCNIEVALLFDGIFGRGVFQHIARTRSTLALSSLELMTQKAVVHQSVAESSLAIDHDRAQKAVILVDEAGYFLGDWRSFDVEGVRQVVLMFHNALRFLENILHIKVVSLFAQKELSREEFVGSVQTIFQWAICDAEPIHEMTEKQRKHVDVYLKKILKVEKGLDASFEECAKGMEQMGLSQLRASFERIDRFTALFDRKGWLIEDRSQIFLYIKDMIETLDHAIHAVTLYTERLDVSLKIKTEVFGYLPQVVSFRDDVEELKVKMGSYPYLTVTSVDEAGRMLPLGVVRARDLQQPILGTVTLRDFCNREEVKIPPYFEVISVIDHHKCDLRNDAAAVVYMSDAQSSNTILAELAFALNDQYSHGNMTEQEVNSELNTLRNSPSTPKNVRLEQKLLRRRLNMSKASSYFIDPEREFIEYLHFTYAILDDTDLLTKVSKRDVDCIVELLHRLKSLSEGKEVEFIDLEDLELDATYVEKATTRILQSNEMHSLYSKVYHAKEALIEENLIKCAENRDSTIFEDTKLQNGCARVGQTKLFPNNFSTYQKDAEKLRQHWLKSARQFFEERREIDLHLQMISTLAGADDLFSGKRAGYTHQDELWIWIPMTEQSIEHLKNFLGALRVSQPVIAIADRIDILFKGGDSKDLEQVFKESFCVPRSIERKKTASKEVLAILRFPAGMMNSRKSMISPCLPQLLN